MREKQLKYKAELDRQRQQNDALKAYGNMSAAEKHINKSDLRAYKSYDYTDHAMVPGGQNFSKLALKASQESGKEPSPSKKQVGFEEKVTRNTDLLKSYGAIHLGEDVATMEPKAYRGAGGVLHAAMNKPQNNRYSMVDRSDSTVGLGPIIPGQHLGIGMAYDGSVNLQNQNHPVRGTSSLGNQQLSTTDVPLPFGLVKGPSIYKQPGLKAEPNLANGGIGVSYSNVVLGGGLNPSDPATLAHPKSSY